MWALLNGDKVLIGFSNFDDSSGVEVPEDCDLKPNKYKWNGEAFIPLGFGQDAIAEQPDVMGAIVDALEEIQKTIPLPKRSADFLTFYKTSIDAAGKK